MPRAAGESFDRYVIDRWIGEGASADVYAALDPKLGRRVALKVLREGADAARVLREVRAAAQVVHPNIVTVYDAGEADGKAFLVMELLAGRSLRAHVAGGGATRAERMHWAMQLASALGAIHAAGLVHRDVKPENVFVTEEGAIKLLDFGIARVTPLVDRAATTHTLGSLAPAPSPPTNDGGLVRGTPAYMAPEQMRGEVLDGRADQFAWGVLVFELLTGARPWIGDDVSLVAAMLGTPPRALREVDASWPKEWDAALRRCLGSRARDRFASMDALMEALRVEAPARDRIAWAARWGLAASLATILGTAFFPRDAAHARAHVERAHAAAPVATVGPKAEAKAAYDEGMILLRKASFRDGVAALHRAASLDASFAEAHLRAAMFAGNPDATARRDLQLARELRAALSARDRALLDAFEPWASVPPNWAETERRLVSMVANEPGDAELRLLIGWNRYHAEDHAGAVKAYEEALAIEPENALAWNLDSLSLLNINEGPRAEAATTRCLAISPAATSCLRAMALFHRAAGRCEDAEALGHRFMALEPRAFEGYEIVGDAVYGARADIGAMRDALLAGARARNDARLGDADVLTRWSVLAGRFEDVPRYASAWEAAVASSGDEWQHYFPRIQRIRLAYETDDRVQLERLAGEFLSKRGAWMSDHSLWSPSIYIWSILYRAGVIDAPSFRARRDEWFVDLHAAKAPGADTMGILWVIGYAEPVKTAEDAATAMAARARFAPPPIDANLAADDRLALGRAAFHSGDIDAAVDIFDRLTKSCIAIRYPFHSIWAFQELGSALEAKGERARACDAYREVITRWRDAPRSRTVSAARARIKALRCEWAATDRR